MFPSFSLALQPGLYTERSKYDAKGRYVDGSLVRFWQNRAERWGGWGRMISPSLGGAARGALAWVANDGTPLVAWGTADTLWLYQRGVLYDITPVGYVPGPNNSAAPGGWGNLAWGGGFWGGVAPPGFPNGYNCRTWTLHKWGEDLVASYRGGPIYHWDFTTGPLIKAQILPTAPQVNLGIFVTEDRHLVAIGTESFTGGVFDPLLVRWANRESLVNWTPALTTTAGEKRAEDGNECVASVQVTGGHLILTDTAAYTFRFIGGNFVFALKRAGGKCGCISPHGAIEMDGVAFWMSDDGFISYDGAIRTVECDVHRYVYDGVNRIQAHKINAGANKAFGEKIWFYAGNGSDEVNRYVAFNSWGWSFGALDRSTWLDDNVVTRTPVATDPSGNVFVHDVGVLGDGSPIPYFLETSDIEMPAVGDRNTPAGTAAATDQHIRLGKVVPDYARLSGDHRLIVYGRNYPSNSETAKGPYPFNATTGHFSPKARGKTLRFRLEGEGDFRLGDMKGYVTADGGRR